MSTTTRIVIADDHDLIRAALVTLLKRDGFEVVADAKDGQEAVEACKWLKPDVAVLDIAMPRMNGVLAARAIREIDPKIKLLIVTSFENDTTVSACCRHADGFLLKSDTATALHDAIAAVLDGKKWFSEKLLEAHATVNEKLTQREQEITGLLAEGKTSKEIAALLNLSTLTVDTHRARIMRKLKLSNVAELVIYAVRHGLVNVNIGTGM